MNLIIVAGTASVANLVTTAAQLDGETLAVVVGSRAVAEQIATSGVDKVIWFGEPGDHPLEAFAPAVAQAATAARPQVVLGGRRPAERVLLGAAAAALRAPALIDVKEVTSQAGTVVVTHGVNGGIAVATREFSGPVALMVDGGGVAPVQGAAPIEETPAATLPMQVTAVQVTAVTEVDLAAAPRVVGAGRGLRAREDLSIVEALAAALEAELACTRPLAEGLDWLPRDRYLGVSGQHIAPRLYVAVGVSGQLQHLAGVRSAETIVAINSDPKAPVLAEADYALVGDLYELVPAITAALEQP